MTIPAVRLQFSMLGSVMIGGNEFKVIWIHATSIQAFVMEVKTFPIAAYENVPNYGVRSSRLPVSDSNHSVAAAVS